MEKNLIGFYDSGVGGLSVLKVALNKIKNKNFAFFADTARMPYGAKTPSEIRQFSIEAMGFLKDLNVELSIIACNTATSYGLSATRKIYDYPILGVVDPGAENAIERTKNKKVGLVATKATVKSGFYEKKIKKLDPEITLKSVYCPDLTIAVEQGRFKREYIDPIVKKYLDEFGDFDYDTLILGCTHYPIVEFSFRRVLKEMGREVLFVDPAYKTVLDAMDELKIPFDNEEIPNRTIDFYITGDIDLFKFTMKKIVDLSDFSLKFHQVNNENLIKYIK